LAQRFRVPIIAGIARRWDDLEWLARQHVHATVADMEPDDGRRTTGDG
jgi:hypothetical protein